MKHGRRFWGFRDGLGGSLSMSWRLLAAVGVFMLITIGVIVPFSLRGGGGIEPPTRVCVAGDLGASAWQNPASPDQLGVSVDATSEFTRCLVPSRFVVILTDEFNYELVRSEVLLESDHNLAMIGNAQGGVRVDLRWTNWCNNIRPRTIYARVEFESGVAAPPRSRLGQVPPELTPTCADPAAPSTLVLGPFGMAGEPVAPDAEVCLAKDLSVRPGGTIANGSSGLDLAFIETTANLATTSRAPCVMPRVVSVALLTGNGEIIARVQSVGIENTGVLALSNYVLFTVRWSSWCGGAMAQPLHGVIELTDGAQVRWEVTRADVPHPEAVIPPCDGETRLSVEARRTY